MATTEQAAGEAKHGGEIDALLQEDRRYPPSEQFKTQANWNDPAIYERAEADPEGFWAEQAQDISWFKPWDKVLEWDVPKAKWFVGAEVNVTWASTLAIPPSVKPAPVGALPIMISLTTLSPSRL